MPSDKMRTARLIEAIGALDVGEVRLMEVCGTHTMSIARSGIKTLLPKNVQLLSGPGCPVCVTPPEVIDAILDLAMRPDVMITSYGDMLRVPGSVLGSSLAHRRALGARVETVYSPMDAVELAERNPDKQIVFLGVGFETTAPGTAAAVLSAQERAIENFSVLSMLKTVENALRTLITTDGFNIDGFICPGHVATVIGANGFEFLPRDYHLPAVVAGFEPEEILRAIYRLLRQIKEHDARVENEYRRAVSQEGNVLAQGILRRCFELREDMWRGLGRIEESGLKLKDEFSSYDAEKRFDIRYSAKPKPTACRCGEVITGRLSPEGCPLFGGRCTPEEPVGPCMVSSEGACAAAYKYRGI